jgi:osmoprotectant transport system permease protein
MNEYLQDHLADIIRLTLEHFLLSTTAVLIALVVAIPIALWAHGVPRRMKVVNALTGAVYSVPSLGLFAMMVPIIGLGSLPTIIGLVLYAQLMLIAAAVTALDGVPDAVRDAALGMGIDRWSILRTVDVPLALPAFVAGLRTATVTLVGIATIGALIDAGGLGEVILQGIQRDYAAQIVVGAAAVTVLAVGIDLALSRLENSLRSRARMVRA